MARQIVNDDGVTVDIEKAVAQSYDTHLKRLSVDTEHFKTTFTADYDTPQNSVAIITPATGKSICVFSVYSSTDQSGTDTVLSFATSNILIYKLYVSKESRSEVARVRINGAIDEPITLTCGAKTYVAVTYIECE